MEYKIREECVLMSNININLKKEEKQKIYDEMVRIKKEQKKNK